MTKKNNRRPLSPQARKRRNAARAKLASFLAVVALCVGITALVKASSSVERPLEVISDEYEYITQTTVVTDENGEVIPAEGSAEDIAKLDPNIAKVANINIQLKDTYPIDMIIRSEYAIVYDVEANEVLYAKNAEEKCYPASTTKILTSSVVLNNMPSDHVFTVGNELDMVNAGSSLAMISKGQQLDTGMIIDGLMLPSGNDAAYCAAANVGRALAKDDMLSPASAVQTFVDEMNRTAWQLGCENTHFANPDGFHDDDHYTTVKDMLRITMYAENFPRLMEAAGTANKYVTLLSGEGISWENSNRLIQTYSDIYYMYATGMKTGMTDQAGYCVVATAERFEHQIICIVFGASASDIRWNDTIALLDAAFVQVRNRED